MGYNRSTHTHTRDSRALAVQAIVSGIRGLIEETTRAQSGSLTSFPPPRLCHLQPAGFLGGNRTRNDLPWLCRAIVPRPCPQVTSMHGCCALVFFILAFFILTPPIYTGITRPINAPGT